MPEKWTGRLVGRMHIERVTCDDLAAELGVTRPYISMILNGHRKPDGIQSRLETALDSVLKKRKGDPNDS